MSELRDPNLAELVGEIADLEGLAIDLPGELALLPLRGNVLFPGIVMPLLVAKPSSVELIEEARRGERLFVAVSLRPESPDDPATEHLFERGTLARIL